MKRLAVTRAVHRVGIAVLLVATARVSAQPAAVHGGMPIVSPDGKRLAFWANRGAGDQLYVIDVDGAHETQLTRSAGNYGRPSWADSTHVVYGETANDTGPTAIYRLSVNGGERVYLGRVSGRNPSMMKDGRVLFVSGGWRGAQLSVAALDGTGERRISDGTASLWNPMVSPDGQQVAYTRSDTGHRVAVWVMNVDGSNAYQATRLTRAEGRAQVPSWSPDGKRLAFQASATSERDSTKTASHIWIVDTQGGAVTKLAPHDEPYLDETPYWFPDGQRIAFQSDRTGRMEVWITSADGTGQRIVTRPAGQAQTPHVSPDGRHIAFTGTTPSGDGVFVAGVDGKDLRRLTDGSGGVWSPDGATLVFQHGEGKPVALINSDGTGERLVAGTNGAQTPSWSPDGNRVLFTGGVFPNLHIQTIRVDGSDRRDVMPDSGFNYDAVWSPDGKRIAFVRGIPRQGVHVFVMNADGTDQRRLTTNNLNEERPAWSPDSRLLAFQASTRGGRWPTHAYIHVVDLGTGAERTLATHDHPYLDETPSWFPDGKRLAIQSNRDGRMSVFVMDLDGNTVARVAP